MTAGTETVADLTREVDVAAGAAPPPPPPPDPELHPRDVLESDFVRSARVAAGLTRPSAVRSTKGSTCSRARLSRGGRGVVGGARAGSHQRGDCFVLGWSYEGTGDHREAIGAWRAAAISTRRCCPPTLRWRMSSADVGAGPGGAGRARRARRAAGFTRAQARLGKSREIMIITTIVTMALIAQASAKATHVCARPDRHDQCGQIEGIRPSSPGRPTRQNCSCRRRSATFKA